MKGVVWLAYRAVAARPLVSTLLALCVGVSIALPITSTLLLDRFETSLRTRAESTPVIVGPDASRFDLTFSTLYFRAADTDPIPRELARDAQRPGLTVIPLKLGDTVRSRPLVGTDDAYYEHRVIRAREGELPFLLGEVALGSSAARALNVSVGDTLPTDPTDGLNLAASSPVELTVVGILERTGTVDDDALFCTLPTAWLADGKLHGHDDARAIEGEENLIGATDDHVALTTAVPTARRVTDETRADFHFHADPDELPLTALILVPDTAKDETIALARLDALDNVRALRSSGVVDELLRTVLSVKSALDSISALFITTTASLLVLIFWLTARLRADETRTMRDIGAAPRTVALLFAWEAGIILALGLTLSVVISLAALLLAHRTLPWV